MAITLRAADADDDAIWSMLEPVFRAGDTYAIDTSVTREDALRYWLAERAFVAERGGQPVGTYYIQRNRPGGGAHFCNCGFVTAPGQDGRGVARVMLAHALDRARALGYRGMVFNFVLATNQRAIATWEKAGFQTVGRIPGAFAHPTEGYVDALVMFRSLV